MHSVHILQMRIYDRVVPLQDIVGYTIDNPLYTLSRVTTRDTERVREETLGVYFARIQSFIKIKKPKGIPISKLIYFINCFFNIHVDISTIEPYVDIYPSTSVKTKERGL